MNVSKKFMLRGPFCAALVTLLILLVPVAPGVAQIVNTKHNLSYTGPGTIKSTTETQICIFCHIPHNALVSYPIWGHQLSSATYVPYTSGTMTSTVTGSVTGSTKLCLSCHDGQVAVNSLALNRAPTMAGGVNYVTGASSFGTDLSANHPVSFAPDTINNTQIHPPAYVASWGLVHLDKGGQLQCTACHDPHVDNRDAVNKKFLQVSSQNSALCVTCHTVPNWVGSAHQGSTAAFTSAQGQHTGYSTVQENGCETCHKPHKASQAQRLLNGSEEATCTPCHQGGQNGNTRNNISNNGGPFGKTYVHPTYTVSAKHVPVTLTPRTTHPSEDAGNLAGTNRHAECQDCHNPHEAATRSTTSGNHYYGTPAYPTNDVAASQDLTGVWGVDPPVRIAWTAPAQTGFTRRDPSTREFQICYKCHSSYAYGSNPPTSPSTGTNGVTVETDQSLEFNTSNASYHAVEGAPVAGLKGIFSGTQWTTTSTMYCSDCHGDDDQNSGWTVPATSGPHGSNNPFILRGPWSTSTGTPTSQTDLCFRCHDFASLTSTGVAADTKFSTANYGGINLHVRHLTLTSTPTPVCMSCHAGVPHGWKRKSLIALAGDGAPYEVVGTAAIKTWTVNSGNYQKADCTTNTGCH